jgi:hypothetical protein
VEAGDKRLAVVSRSPWTHHLKLATVSSIIQTTFPTTFSTTFSPTTYSYHYRRLRRVCNLYYYYRFPPGLWVIRQKSVRLWSCVPLQDSLSVGSYYRLLRGLDSQCRVAQTAFILFSTFVDSRLVSDASD